MARQYRLTSAVRMTNRLMVLSITYGAINWVRNARKAGIVNLRRGRHVETVRVAEVGPREGAPVIREYVRCGSISRPYFDVGLDSPIEAYEAEAPRHPVFWIVGTSAPDDQRLP